MKRLLLLLCSPLLLAPIRYQSGGDVILLTPVQSLASSSYALPAAVGLSTPTVIMLSPTVVEVSATVSATAVTPSVVVSGTLPQVGPQQVIIVAPQELLMPSATAVICNHALQMVAEMAILSYQQQRQQASMNLTIATTIAAAEVAERRYPLLTASMDALGQLEYNTPQKQELNTAMGMAQAICKLPPGVYRAPVPGTRIPVPRPD